MRPVVAIVLLLTLLVPPAARSLDLPVRDVRRESVGGPSYVADRIEVRLVPVAAARARAARATGAAAADLARTRLGLAALDAVAAELGAWFEPEFRGETPPPAGSADADFTAFYIAHLPEGTDLENALARLGGLAEVQSAQPIAVLPVSAVPNDSLWSSSWWFDQPSGCSIHAPQAWDAVTGDTSIVVAILDSGVLPYHPDLGGTVAGQAGRIWTNWAEQGGAPGVDDDGNGFVDDTWGWDFVHLPTIDNRLPTGQWAPFEDWLDQDNDPNDYAGHGTMVAGLVGALTDNGIGVAGTAWRVSLMPLRMGWSENANSLGAAYVDMSFAAQAVRYATRMRADVINCSFMSLDLSGLGLALDAAIRAGVTVVAAAGNNSPYSYIGMREDVIAVAATDASDQIASSSNRGSWVDLAAPGVGILSTSIIRAPLASDSLTYRQPSYAGLSGTSFAAPLVAGGAALLQSRQKALGLRSLPPRGVQLRLRETADDISSLNSGTGYGTGRLNLERALNDRPTSTAWRAAGKSVGPAVPIPLNGPASKLAWVTSTSRFLIQDWLTGDTLSLVTLPGVPARQLAAANMGGGHGVGLFVGTQNGWLAGFDTTGAALPGFPVSPGGTSSLAGGPVLGDLDGDGELEVVCGTGDGRLCAWHADGSVVAGFPVETGVSGFGAPVALTDLGGHRGVEIIAAAQGGMIHAVDGDGMSVPGWPVTFDANPLAPVVTRFGRDTVVLVAAGTQLIGLRRDGSERSRWTLDASVASDPALGELDGDGSDEIVLAATSPDQVIVLDSAGVAPVGRNWPAALTAAPLGPPVLGHLGDGGAPGVLLMQTGGLVALADGVVANPLFPKPGGAGTYPTLADLTGDGAMKIAAGSGSDSLIYVYDVGVGSAAELSQDWLTPRGNYARTGSRLYSATDTLPPDTLVDLPAGLALAVRPRPSRAPVLLDWSGANATDIRLYDVSGRRVRTLRLARGGHGTEEWNGRDESGCLVPAGLYFARLTGGSLHSQARIVLLH